MQQVHQPRPESGAVALAELSRSVGSMDWGPAIRRIVEFDADALRVDRVSYWDLCEDSASIFCEAGYVRSHRSFEHGARLLERDLPEYFRAMREERVIDMVEVQTDPRCRGLRAYCAAREIASMLDVPVWSEGRLCGVLCHEHVGAQRHWSDREVEFVTGISQVASSVRTARAHSRAEAAAQRACFLDAVSRSLFSLDGRVVASRAAALCVPRMADFVLLWGVDGGGSLECLGLEHVGGMPTEFAETPKLARVVVLQQQSLLIPDLTRCVLERYGFGPAERATIERFGFSSAMSVPLEAAGDVLGAMSFLAKGRHFGADDLELAESVGSRVAGALENARLYATAQEAIRARDELLAVTAHELRTPLTALLLETDHMLQLARRRQDVDATARSEKIAGHARRFGALVDYVLDALRIRTQGLAVSRTPCDIAAVLRRRVSRIGPRAQTAGSKITVDAPPSLIVSADRVCMEKLFDALLENAVKFGCGRPISISLRRDEKWTELSVRDQGMGIAPERMSSLFRPFERASSSAHFGGLGLGLYIAKAIAEAHGGSVRVTSTPGEGSTFGVRLPP